MKLFRELKYSEIHDQEEMITHSTVTFSDQLNNKNVGVQDVKWKLKPKSCVLISDHSNEKRNTKGEVGHVWTRLCSKTRRKAQISSGLKFEEAAISKALH